MSDNVRCVYRATLTGKINISTPWGSNKYGATIQVHARDGGFCLILLSKYAQRLQDNGQDED